MLEKVLLFVCFVLLVSLFVTWVITVVTKFGWRDKIIATTDIELLAKMLQCDFCFSFWASVVCSIILACYNPIFIIIPVFSAPISRKMLE